MTKTKTAPERKPDSPDEIARRAIALLKSKADPEKAVLAQRYFKEGVIAGSVK